MALQWPRKWIVLSELHASSWQTRPVQLQHLYSIASTKVGRRRSLSNITSTKLLKLNQSSIASARWHDWRQRKRLMIRKYIILITHIQTVAEKHELFNVSWMAKDSVVGRTSNWRHVGQLLQWALSTLPLRTCVNWLTSHAHIRMNERWRAVSVNGIQCSFQRVCILLLY